MAVTMSGGNLPLALLNMAWHQITDGEQETPGEMSILPTMEAAVPPALLRGEVCTSAGLERLAIRRARSNTARGSAVSTFL